MFTSSVISLNQLLIVVLGVSYRGQELKTSHWNTEFLSTINIHVQYLFIDSTSGLVLSMATLFPAVSCFLHSSTQFCQDPSLSLLMWVGFPMKKLNGSEAKCHYTQLCCSCASRSKNQVMPLCVQEKLIGTRYKNIENVML